MPWQPDLCRNCWVNRSLPCSLLPCRNGAHRRPSTAWLPVSMRWCGWTRLWGSFREDSREYGQEADRETGWELGDFSLNVHGQTGIGA